MVKKMMKLFKNKQTNKQRELNKKRIEQQRQANNAILGKTNSVNFNYWDRLITTCRVEKDIELMDLLDFYCVDYSLLKGGR